MNAHPQLSKEDASEIVKYVLSVSNQEKEAALPQSGSIVLKDHINSGEEGRYILTASYTDKGGAITPLTTKTNLVLRPAKVQAESADLVYNLQKSERSLGTIHNGSYFVFKGINLKDITGLTYRYSSQDKDAAIEVHTGSPKGPVISTLNYKATGGWNKYTEVSTPITDPGGKHDLYFVFVKNDTPNKHLASIDWVRYDGGKEVIIKETPTVKAKPADGTTTKNTTAGKPATTAAKTKGSVAKTGSVLIANSDCKTCHNTTQKLIGPSYKQIATRYNISAANINKLVNKVINGGAGTWGQIPMTPHPQISKKDAAQMVQYILSLK
jgi:cytochrome c